MHIYDKYSRNTINLCKLQTRAKVPYRGIVRKPLSRLLLLLWLEAITFLPPSLCFILINVGSTVVLFQSLVIVIFGPWSTYGVWSFGVWILIIVKFTRESTQLICLGTSGRLSSYFVDSEFSPKFLFKFALNIDFPAGPQCRKECNDMFQNEENLV